MTKPAANRPTTRSTTATPGQSTTATGRAAEQLAADHLAARGLAILDRNWRNRWCELDIVTRQFPGESRQPAGATSTGPDPTATDPDTAPTIHFVEVKYRATTRFGAAADYISHDKIARLKRAALAWNQAHQYDGPYQIDVITVEGPLTNPVIQYLPNVISD